MEYIFGLKGTTEILKTKGSYHTTLVGWQEVTREYPDQTITDRFRVTKHILGRGDAEGNMYDWYKITDHTRQQDRTKPIKEEMDTRLAQTDELAIDLYEAQAAQDETLIQLYEMIGEMTQ